MCVDTSYALFECDTLMQWLPLVTESRPHENETFDTDISINDIRNVSMGGLHVCECRQSENDHPNIKVFFKLIGAFMWIVIYCRPFRLPCLQTPNFFVTTDDVPPIATRVLQEDVACPRTERFTLQWLVQPSQAVIATLPNNIDAIFKKDTQEPKPSDLPLHYSYGVTAVKQWGTGTEFLSQSVRPNIPCPATPQAEVQGRSAPNVETHVDGETTMDADFSSGWPRKSGNKSPRWVKT
jgi:hypothetical protein